ncbi:hypothetical protein NDA12_007480 [Ustilago hordei]|nr:hypothetical protein NDA12_007480 [Ustilago hordei]
MFNQLSKIKSNSTGHGVRRPNVAGYRSRPDHDCDQADLASQPIRIEPRRLASVVLISSSSSLHVLCRAV